MNATTGDEHASEMKNNAFKYATIVLYHGLQRCDIGVSALHVLS